jgi:signal transduction histidine kinase
MNDAPTHPTYPGSGARRRSGTPWRWWGLLGGVLIGFTDAALMALLGARFEINGHDASLLAGAYFGPSFAMLGYLLGRLVEGRRRDQENAALVQAQMEAINAARARLVQAEKLAALGQLAATVAHEVRNPLAVMRSAAQNLGETLPGSGDDGRQACSFILAEIDRLGSVITSLLAFARPPQIVPRAVSVRELLDRALLLAGEEMEKKRVRAHRDERNAPATVRADPDLVSQVLLGLLSNAVEAVPQGGEISLRARPSGNAVEIDVADSGPGVPAELRAKIFEPFFTTRPRGTGLGLAVARQIAEAHGGRLDVGEARGGGACFTLRLPTVEN